MSSQLAALGLRAHSGWAVAVAVAGSPSLPVVLERSRIVICNEAIPGSKQPYHAAERMELPEAEAWINLCWDRSVQLAVGAILGLAEDLAQKGYRLAGAGLLFASGRKLPELPAILKSHALLHTAEGQFYREVLANASEQCSLPIRRIVERDVWAEAETMLGMPAADLRSRISELGRVIGPPWREDEKLASLAAWITLATEAA